MPNNIHRFRTVKHGGPQKKFKMLPDPVRKTRLSLVLVALAIVGGLLTVAIVYAARL